VKDLRIGEHLWEEWDGLGFKIPTYFTFEHVDMDNEIVRRALASSLQRDGICHSLADGFKSIETSETTHGWVGNLEGEEEEMAICDEDGETPYGDFVDNIKEVTWIEL
jgi:hypothetical protein